MTVIVIVPVTAHSPRVCAKQTRPLNAGLSSAGLGNRVRCQSTSCSTSPCCVLVDAAEAFVDVPFVPRKPVVLDFSSSEDEPLADSSGPLRGPSEGLLDRLCLRSHPQKEGPGRTECHGHELSHNPASSGRSGQERRESRSQAATETSRTTSPSCF